MSITVTYAVTPPIHRPEIQTCVTIAGVEYCLVELVDVATATTDTFTIFGSVDLECGDSITGRFLVDGVPFGSALSFACSSCPGGQ